MKICVYFFPGRTQKLNFCRWHVPSTSTIMNSNTNGLNQSPCTDSSSDGSEPRLGPGPAFFGGLDFLRRAQKFGAFIE